MHIRLKTILPNRLRNSALVRLCNIYGPYFSVTFSLPSFFLNITNFFSSLCLSLSLCLCVCHTPFILFFSSPRHTHSHTSHSTSLQFQFYYLFMDPSPVGIFGNVKIDNVGKHVMLHPLVSSRLQALTARPKNLTVDCSSLKALSSHGPPLPIPVVAKKLS